VNDFLPTRTQQPHLWEEGHGSPPGRVRSPRLLEIKVDEPKKPGVSWSGVLKQFFLLAFITVFSISSYYLVSHYVITAVMVQGRSMTPTLQDGERYFLNRWELFFRQPHRGDIVVIRDTGHTDLAVKRIIGLPSDALRLKDGQVYLNGELLKESYLLPGTKTIMNNGSDVLIQLGTNQYFVMGDNRGVSEDSRVYGTLKRDQIIGLLVK